METIAEPSTSGNHPGEQISRIAERAAQGLPPEIEDPVVIARIVALVLAKATP